MLVQYGAGVLGASGSIGGATASHNRFGSYWRSRTIPVNPQSSRQNKIRAVMQALAQRWSNTLTQTQRDGWEVYAAAITRTNKLGGQIKLTGSNHFMRSNSIRLQQDSTIIDAPPTILTLPAGDPIFVCTVDEGAQQITVVFDTSLPWDTQDNAHLIISMSIPKATGTNFIGGPMRIAGTVDGSDPVGVSSPVQIAVPFPVAENQAIVCTARISENDGRLSDPFRSQSVVTS